MRNPARALIIAPHASYRTASFIAAAERLDLKVVIASDSPNSIISAYAQGLHIDFDNPESALQTLLQETRRYPFAAVIGTDDNSTELAAALSKQLDLPFNEPASVRIARRKDLARARLAAAGLPVPTHRLIKLNRSLAEQSKDLVYPCVLKPLALAASRGVIRADNALQFQAAAARIQAIMRDAKDTSEGDWLLVEAFIPGAEVAVEGMLLEGKLQILTIFDKPDPLDGPFFEETYYITPSRHPVSVQVELQRQIEHACQAYGLQHGPVHAECRINDQGVWILEVAARTIGGLCAQLLRFGTGYGLEELVLAQASGKTLSLQAESGGAGVLMIPIPEAGILRRIEGLSAARQIEFIDEIVISVREGYELVPLPEGASYLGFIFARAPSPEQAEAALRKAHSCLKIVVAPVWRAAVISR